MNCHDKLRVKFPHIVKAGNAVVKIYRGKAGGYDLFTVVHYRDGVDVLNAGLKGMSTNAAARELGYRLTSDSDAPLEKRWISIPQNVWHQPVISKEADWVVVSFHTVPAEELIEERPETSGHERTKQMRYLG
jgi:hypothetical protein